MFIGWERVNYPIIKKPEIERTEWKLNELSKYGNKNLDTPHGFYTRDTFLYSSYWLDSPVKCLLIGLICTPWNFCALVPTYVDYLPQRYVHSMNKSFVLDGWI